MSGLTNGDRKRILHAAKEIYIHKYMQIKGYKALINRISDETLQNFLRRFCEKEEAYTQFWVDQINELGGSRPSSRDWKVRLIMSVLGTKGFFEWAIIGEEEGINELNTHANKIHDPPTSQKWNRLAIEERLHLNRIKNEVLGIPDWEIRGAMGIRDMILGANDGLVSILATVAAMVGSPDVTSSYLVLLAGIAGLFAGTFSMGASSYQSSKSELEVLERENRQTPKGKTPEEEMEALVESLVAEGYSIAEANALVSKGYKEKEQIITTDILDEIGLAPEEIGSPLKAGVLTGLSFAISAVVPIVPFVIENKYTALGISIVCTLVALFGVGVIKTIFSRKNWIRSGLEMTAIGASAAAITFLIGRLTDILLPGSL